MEELSKNIGKTILVFSVRKESAPEKLELP